MDLQPEIQKSKSLESLVSCLWAEGDSRGREFHQDEAEARSRACLSEKATKAILTGAPTVLQVSAVPKLRFPRGWARGDRAERGRLKEEAEQPPSAKVRPSASL